MVSIDFDIVTNLISRFVGLVVRIFTAFGDALFDYFKRFLSGAIFDTPLLIAIGLITVVTAYILMCKITGRSLW